jgi:hypothetical protein
MLPDRVFGCRRRAAEPALTAPVPVTTASMAASISATRSRALFMPGSLGARSGGRSCAGHAPPLPRYAVRT